MGGQASELNKDQRVGTGISIPVYPGDNLDLSVEAYYVDATGHGTSGTQLAVMTNAVAGAFGGLSGGNETQQFIYDLFNTNVGGSLLVEATNYDELPSAYLNFLVFDENFKLNTDKSGYVGVGGDEGQVQLLTASNILIDEPGYVYIYVSYEGTSSNFVYFDDLTVHHNEGRVQQYNEYYPFGLQTANSWERVWSEPNKFLNTGGNELNAETGYYQTFFRPYDPALGRFVGIDPLASFFKAWNPYQYGFNDPVYYSDPTGAAPVGVDQMEVFYQNAFGVGKSGRRNDRQDPESPCINGMRHGWPCGGGGSSSTTGDAFLSEHGNSPAAGWGIFRGHGNSVVGKGNSSNSIDPGNNNWTNESSEGPLANGHPLLQALRLRLLLFPPPPSSGEINGQGSYNDFVTGKVRDSGVVGYSEIGLQIEYFMRQALGLSIYSAWTEEDSHDIGTLETKERFKALTDQEKRDLEFLRHKYREEFGREFGTSGNDIGDIDNFISTQMSRLKAKLGKKIGKGLLPFDRGSHGTNEAIEIIRLTLKTPSQSTGIIPREKVRGDHDLIHIYSDKTGYTVSLRVIGNGKYEFDTLIPGKSTKF